MQAVLAASVALLAIFLSGCGGGGPFITPPVGTMGYTVPGTTYSGASTSRRASSGNVEMLKIFPTFNAAGIVTIWIPAHSSVGTFQTGNNANGTCFVQLDDTTATGEGESPLYSSTALSGTV